MGKSKRKSKKRIILAFFIAFALGIPAVFYLNSYFLDNEVGHIPLGKLQRAEHNYSKEVREIAAELNLSYEYLMALIVLETSGTKPAGSRFEKHIYKKLIQLQEGKRAKFEDLTPADVQGASDEAIRNLATSWGPFQLMGYKCLGLGVNIRDIRDEGSLKLGARWIKKEYGHLLKKKRYRDAFHYHNTGKLYPSSGVVKTHDPNYVSKGLTYMDYFRVTEE